MMVNVHDGLLVLSLLLAVLAFRRASALEGVVEDLKDQLRSLERRLSNSGLGEPFRADRGQGTSALSKPNEDKASTSRGKGEPEAPQTMPRERNPVVTPPPLPPHLPEGKAAESAPLAGASRTMKKPALNWEQFMGVRLFAWLGGFALFLAMAFLVKYSLDRDLISPALRVTIGFVVGTGLLATGVRVSRVRYRVTADTLCAVGVVTLYAVTFACRVVYHFAFFGPTVTFGLMSAITTVAFLLAVRKNALVIAVLGMLGGFLTPILVSSDSGGALALFSYIAILDLGLIGVASVRRWDWLNLGAAIGTVAMQCVWVIEGLVDVSAWAPLAVYQGFSVLFLAAAVWAMRRGELNTWLYRASSLLPIVTLLFLMTSFAREAIWSRPGLLYVYLLGADFVLLALTVIHLRHQKLSLAGGGLVFAILSLWTFEQVNDDLLYWALGGYLAFAVIHTAFPIMIKWRWPESRVSPWSQLFPAVALVTTLIPMLNLEALPFSVWSVVLLIDLVAIGAACLTSSLVGLLLAFLVTFGLALLWFSGGGVGSVAGGEVLILVGGMGAVFMIGSLVATRLGAGVCGGEGNGDDGKRSPRDLGTQLMAVSGILPFLLLTLVMGRLEESPLGLIFGVTLLLVGLILSVAKWARSEWLPAVGLLGTYLIELAWMGTHTSPSNAAKTTLWMVLFYGVFVGFPFLGLRRQFRLIGVWVTAAISGPLQFLLIYDLVKGHWPNDVMGLVPLAFALPSLGAVLWLWRLIPTEHENRNRVLAWFAGVAVLFLILVIPIQFERQWLTLGWALQGVGLVWLYRKIPHAGLRYCGSALLFAAFCRLALNPAVYTYHVRGDFPVLNWYLYAYGTVSVCLFLAPRWLRDPGLLLWQVDLRGPLYAMGTVLAFLLVNIEVADYFSEPGQAVLSFKFSGNFARDMSYTIVWGVFSLIVLVVGMLRRVRLARYAGIGLMAVTLLKLFFHDLASLTQLYRIGALVGVALMAMFASFLYQKLLSEQVVKGEGDAEVNEPRE